MAHTEKDQCTSDCRKFGCPNDSPDISENLYAALAVFVTESLTDVCICDNEEYQGCTCPVHGKFVCF